MPSNLAQQAIELLAAEFDAERYEDAGIRIRDGKTLHPADKAALRAIEKALSTRPSMDGVEPTVSGFETSQAKLNRISPMTKVRELAASPYPDDDRVKVPIRFGDIRWIENRIAELEALASLPKEESDLRGISVHASKADASD